MDEQLEHYQRKLDWETDPSDLFEARRAGQAVAIVDARSPAAFLAEHIPGSLNLPHREMSEATTAHLDRSVLHVVYCDGIGCNASTKGALRLTRLGFKVQELIGGLEWWKRDGYATEGTHAKAGERPDRCGC